MTPAEHDNRLLAAALDYATVKRWPVFPLRPGTKLPATPTHTADACDQRDPRCREGHAGWEARATCETDRVTRAWTRKPYGIGIACGPSGLLVVDLDVAKGTAASGQETLTQLEHDHGQALPATWTVGTPSGGRHLYYRQPPGPRLGNTAGRVGPGIDTRGWGGYVAAPPTTTPSGDYWLVDDHPPVDLPSWFAQLLTPVARSTSASQPDRRQMRQVSSTGRARRYVGQAVTGELERIADAVEGRRNHTLFCSSVAFGQLVGAGVLGQGDAEELLEAAARQHVAAGAYSTTQARQTIASGLRRGLREPRELPNHLTTNGARQ